MEEWWGSGGGSEWWRERWRGEGVVGRGEGVVEGRGSGREGVEERGGSGGAGSSSPFMHAGSSPPFACAGPHRHLHMLGPYHCSCVLGPCHCSCVLGPRHCLHVLGSCHRLHVLGPCCHSHMLVLGPCWVVVCCVHIIKPSWCSLFSTHVDFLHVFLSLRAQFNDIVVIFILYNNNNNSPLEFCQTSAGCPLDFHWCLPVISSGLRVLVCSQSIRKVNWTKRSNQKCLDKHRKIIGKLQ